MDLTTTYLGLALPHPFVCGASPLSADLDMVLRLEDAGAAAIVTHSLFEEQIVEQARRRAGHAEAGAHADPQNPYAQPPGAYLEHLLRLKSRLGIPVIASLNGTSAEGWLQYARALERAGADALELNFYHVATDIAENGAQVEQRVLDIVAVVKESVTIPVAVKLSPFYSSLPNMAVQLERIGADGLVLFNRFYESDIDPDTCGPVDRLQLSTPADLVLRLHALAILSGRVHLSLAVTGGVDGPLDAIKAIMAGADAVQLVSTLLRHGPSRLRELRRQVERWAVAHRYESVGEFRGTASLARRTDLARFERRSYLSVLQSWTVDHATVQE